MPNQVETQWILTTTKHGGSQLILKASKGHNHYARWCFSEPYLNVVAIDAKNRGIADWLYLASDHKLIRINLSQLSRSEQTWTLDFNKIKTDQPLVVGRHPLGEGVLIYVFTQSVDTAWHLMAFGDPLLRGFELKTFFNFDIEVPQTQLLLAADWLFFASHDSLYQVDAYTGRLNKYRLPYTLSSHSTPALKLIVKPPSSNQAFIEIEGEKVQIAIDLERRLGRRAWHDS